jgi:hypothetical protein
MSTTDSFLHIWHQRDSTLTSIFTRWTPRCFWSLILADHLGYQIWQQNVVILQTIIVIMKAKIHVGFKYTCQDVKDVALQLRARRVNIYFSHTKLTYFIYYLLFCPGWVIFLIVIIWRVVITGAQSFILCNKYISRLDVHMDQLHGMDIPENNEIFWYAGSLSCTVLYLTQN